MASTNTGSPQTSEFGHSNHRNATTEHHGPQNGIQISGETVLTDSPLNYNVYKAESQYFIENANLVGKLLPEDAVGQQAQIDALCKRLDELLNYLPEPQSNIQQGLYKKLKQWFGLSREFQPNRRPGDSRPSSEPKILLVNRQNASVATTTATAIPSGNAESTEYGPSHHIPRRPRLSTESLSAQVRRQTTGQHGGIEVASVQTPVPHDEHSRIINLVLDVTGELAVALMWQTYRIRRMHKEQSLVDELSALKEDTALTDTKISGLHLGLLEAPSTLLYTEHDKHPKKRSLVLMLLGGPEVEWKAILEDWASREKYRLKFKKKVGLMEEDISVRNQFQKSVCGVHITFRVVANQKAYDDALRGQDIHDTFMILCFGTEDRENMQQAKDQV